VLFLEYALEHEKFFPAAMHMRREMALWCVADDRGGARNLITDPIEHTSLHTGHGRSLPVERGGVHNDALGEICVKVHGARL
jgi:hypothetical protein